MKHRIEPPAFILAAPYLAALKATQKRDVHRGPQRRAVRGELHIERHAAGRDECIIDAVEILKQRAVPASSVTSSATVRAPLPSSPGAAAHRSGDSPRPVRPSRSPGSPEVPPRITTVLCANDDIGTSTLCKYKTYIPLISSRIVPSGSLKAAAEPSERAGLIDCGVSAHARVLRQSATAKDCPILLASGPMKQANGESDELRFNCGSGRFCRRTAPQIRSLPLKEWPSLSAVLPFILPNARACPADATHESMSTPVEC
jgi:hypothetical protein